MTQLSRFLGLAACLYFLEHGVPHVHIFHGRPSKSKKTVIIIRISDGYVFHVGSKFPANRVQPAVHWAKLRRNELLRAWEECRAGKNPAGIEPLTIHEFSPPRQSRYNNWAPCIRRLERLGDGRVRTWLDDGRVFLRVCYPHADTARIIDGGHAVKRNRADTIYEGARAFVLGPHVHRVR